MLKYIFIALCLCSSLYAEETGEFEPNIWVPAPAFAFEDFLWQVFKISGCEEDPVNLSPYLKELEQSPLSAEDKASYRKKLTNAHSAARKHAKAEAKLENLSFEDYQKRECYAYINAQPGDKPKYVFARMSHKIRNNPSATIEEIRKNYTEEEE